jgi:hypothetical protein
MAGGRQFTILSPPVFGVGRLVLQWDRPPDKVLTSIQRKVRDKRPKSAGLAQCILTLCNEDSLRSGTSPMFSVRTKQCPLRIL